MVHSTKFNVLALHCAAVTAVDVVQAYDMALYEAATVSVTVKSQITLQPFHHRIRVGPSCRLPSDRARPCGSLMMECRFFPLHARSRSIFVNNDAEMHVNQN